MARLDRARRGDRGRDQRAADRAGGRSSPRCAIRCCWPSSSRRSTCSPGPAGRAADRELGGRRVRGAGRAVRRPRRDPGRAARGDARRLDADARGLRRRATSASRTSTASPSRTGRSGPRDVVRRPDAAPRAAAGGSSATAAASTRSAPPPTPTSSAWPRRWRRPGRDIAELELVGGIRGRFAGADGVADLDEALAGVPADRARLHARSASSRRCSPTTATRLRTSALESSRASPQRRDPPARLPGLPELLVSAVNRRPGGPISGV